MFIRGEGWIVPDFIIYFYIFAFLVFIYVWINEVELDEKVWAKSSALAESTMEVEMRGKQRIEFIFLAKCQKELEEKPEILHFLKWKKFLE